MKGVLLNWQVDVTLFNPETEKDYRFIFRTMAYTEFGALAGVMGSLALLTRQASDLWMKPEDLLIRVLAGYEVDTLVFRSEVPVNEAQMLERMYGNLFVRHLDVNEVCGQGSESFLWVKVLHIDKGFREQHKAVLEIAIPGNNVGGALDTAYRLTQNVEDGWVEKLARDNRYTCKFGTDVDCRSTAVGDIIIVGSEVYTVAGNGFSRIA